MRAMSQPAVEDRPSAYGSFPTTHWSGILAAGQDVDTKGDTALAELCHTYWYPIYAFARRKGYQPADSQDLAQAFFRHVIEKQLVRRADPQKGRFRSFLLGCFTHFLGSETERQQALKRGGGFLMLSIDLRQAEGRFSSEPTSSVTPEQLFDRHWAVTVLDNALARLEKESGESGRAELFTELLPMLEGDRDGPSYSDIARRMGITEASVRVTVHRLRRRYRELVRAVVSQTLNDPLDVDAELAHLRAALRP